MYIDVNLTGTNWDGTWRLDLDNLNGRELNLIKKVSGVRLGELDDALAAGDFDLVVAFAVIALMRANRVPKDRAMDAAGDLLEKDVDNFDVKMGADADDADPPSVTTTEDP